MARRWTVILTLASALVLFIAGCGRVDLEDLTPEAAKTQEAVAAVTQTAIAESAGEFFGDPDRGRTTWDTWCIGCHAETGNGAGPDIRGNVYLWPDWETFFREGATADGALTHEANGQRISYEPTELTDQNFFNLLAYVAQQSR